MMLQNELVQLYPFYLSQILYWFISYIPTEQPGIKALLVKCLPVFCLFNYLCKSSAYKNGNQLVQWLAKGKYIGKTA